MHNRVSSVSSFNIHKCDTIASAFYLFNFTFVSLYYGTIVFTILFFFFFFLQSTRTDSRCGRRCLRCELASKIQQLLYLLRHCDKTKQTHSLPLKLIPVNMQSADRRPSEHVAHQRSAFFTVVLHSGAPDFHR